MAPRQADEPPTTFQPIGDPRSDPPEPRDRSRVTAQRDGKLARPREVDTPAMPPLYRSEPAPKRSEPARTSSRPSQVEDRRAPTSGQRRDGRRPSDTGPPTMPPLLPAASSRPAPAPHAEDEAPTDRRTAFGPVHIAVAAATLLIGYFVGRAREDVPPDVVPPAASAPIAAPTHTAAAEVEVDDVDDVDVQVEVAPRPAPPPEPLQPPPPIEPRPAVMDKLVPPVPRPAIQDPPAPPPKAPAPKPVTGDPYGDDPPPAKPAPKPPSDDPYGDG